MLHKQNDFENQAYSLVLQFLDEIFVILYSEKNFCATLYNTLKMATQILPDWPSMRLLRLLSERPDTISFPKKGTFFIFFLITMWLESFAKNEWRRRRLVTQPSFTLHIGLKPEKRCLAYINYCRTRFICLPWNYNVPDGHNLIIH